jgi:adenylate kinase
LTDYAKQNGLLLGEDVKRCTAIVDEEKMRSALADAINQSKASVVVDGHFAASVVANGLSTCVFVLRRSPVELRVFMQKEGFSEDKMYENLLAEVLDVCLVEALQVQTGRVCEFDVTGKTVEQVVDEVFGVVLEQKECSCGGVVDWLDFLEHEGLLGQYLKV